MTTQRVRFPGDPAPVETGTGRAPEIPLSKAVQPTTVEMLPQQGDDDGDDDEAVQAAPAPSKKSPKRAAAAPPTATSPEDDDDDDGYVDEAAQPAYKRERIGARIGEPVEAAAATTVVEQTLDGDDVVPLLFPTRVKLQDAGIMHEWAPGVHLVPVSLAGRKPKDRHWWLKRNNVRHAGPVQVRAAS